MLVATSHSVAVGKEITTACSWTEPTTNHINPFACYLRSPFELRENDSLTITSETDANQIMEVNFWLTRSSRHHWHIDRVPKIIFAKFPQLQRFILPARIDTIHASDFVDAKHMQHLHLANLIKAIPSRAFSAMNALQLLDLSENRITVIDAGAFDGLPALRTVNLSRNQLKRIKTAAFRGAPELAELLLNHNKIETIDRLTLDLPQLKRLDLSYNRLIELPTDAFELCSQLEWLDLKANRLKAITQSMQPLQQLQYVNLDHNAIGDVRLCALAALPRLEQLRLENNGRALNDSIFVCDDKPSYGTVQMPLRILHLSGNALRHREILLQLWSYGVTQLEELRIDNNEFEHINFYPIAAFPKLKEIDLGLNRWKCDWLEETVAKLESDGIDLNLYSSHFPTSPSYQHVNFIQCT